MKKIQLILLVAIIHCFVTKSFSQKGYYTVFNGFGIIGGNSIINSYSIKNN